MASGLINRSGVSGAAWHGYKSVGHGHWYVWSLLIALALLSGCSALLDLQGGQTCETHSQCDASRYCFSQNENEPTRCQPRDNCTTNLDCEAGTACLSLGDGGGSVCTSSACGDGSVDSPETCDGDCPTTCDDSNACTVDAMEGSAELCSATCVFVPVTGCSLESDGCCPASCSASNDADCDSVCGNGLVEPGEICDGDCPNACSDADACTVDMLSGHVATCNAVCSFEEILECAHGDGCCPTGCTQLNDADCEPACGNGVIEDGETCDGDCPELCEAADSCSVSSLSGSAGDCNVVCHEASITQCGGLDGCCPAGCDQTSDADCDGSCGDEVLDPGETCDGDCPTNCEDGIACTEHLLTGTPGSCDVLCHTNIVSACVHGDGCCPAGCSFGVDDDCDGVCDGKTRSVEFHGHVTVLKALDTGGQNDGTARSSNWTVDSFFDVFIEMSPAGNGNGSTPSVPTEILSMDLTSSARLFGDPDFDVIGDDPTRSFDTEILSMDLTSSVMIFGDPDFDLIADGITRSISTEILSMDLTTSTRLFGDPDFDFVGADPARSFDTEILSMDLRSSVRLFGDPDFDVIGDEPTRSFPTEMLSMDLTSSARLFGDPDFAEFLRPDQFNVTTRAGINLTKRVDKTSPVLMILGSNMSIPGSSPSFGTAAHEVTHVLQQSSTRSGTDSSTVQTEILSMDLSSSSIFGDPDFDAFDGTRLSKHMTLEVRVNRWEASRTAPDPDPDDGEIPLAERTMDWEFRGHVTVLKARDDAGDPDLRVDSFFDVFTEVSSNGGRKGLNAVNVKVTATTDDDAIRSNVSLRIRPIDGKNEVGSWDTEILSMDFTANAIGPSLNLSTTINLSSLRSGGTTGSWDTEILSMDLTASAPGPDLNVSSTINLSSLRSGDETGIFETEILSMDLTARATRPIPEDRPLKINLSSLVSFGGDRTIQTEILSMDLSGSSSPRSDFVVDSFFDVTYRRRGDVVLDDVTLRSSSNFTVDSFFDITYRVERSNTTGTFQTEILSMDLSGSTGPGGTFNVDSFFDVSYRRRGGAIIEDVTLRSWNNFTVDSFFDVSYRVRRSNTTGTFQTEILSMDLSGSAGPGGAITVDTSTTYASRRRGGTVVEDITASASSSFVVDSFFDITYQVRRSNTTGTFQTEMLSMDLTGSAPIPITIDSFFDITYRREEGDQLEESRVKVKFPWLLDSGDDGESTGSLQVAGIFGDPDFDTFFFPEVDDEILVSFQKGDLRHPVILGMLYNGEGDPDSAPPDLNVTVTRTLTEGGVVVRENGLHLSGGDLTFSQLVLTEDIPGLHSYSYEYSILGLVPGEEPVVRTDVEYLPAGPNRYHAVVHTDITTKSDADGDETRVRTTIETFEVEVDPATGEVVERLLFTDLIDVTASKTVRVAADGIRIVSREIRTEVQNIKNDS